MGGIYGAMLPAFSEQLREVTYYEADPKVGAGYEEPKNVKKLYVIFQRFGSAPYNAALTVPTAGERTQNANGSSVNYKQLMVWCDNFELLLGSFIKRKINGKDEIYKVMADNGWIDEVGYFVCLVERVMGDNGSNTEVITPNLGTDFFG
jgi:hypothetical protein